MFGGVAIDGDGRIVVCDTANGSSSAVTPSFGCHSRAQVNVSSRVVRFEVQMLAAPMFINFQTRT
jgi:hypothetical protein